MFELFAVLAALVLSAVVAAHGMALAPRKRPQQLSAGRNEGFIQPFAALESTFVIDYSERSDPSEDLVSQHWREAASLWVARSAQGETLTKRRTNVQSDGASKCHGVSELVTRGSAKREGEPLPSVARMCRAKVQLILKEPLPTAGIQSLDLSAWKARAKRIVTRRAKTNTLHRLAW